MLNIFSDLILKLIFCKLLKYSHFGLKQLQYFASNVSNIVTLEFKNLKSENGN